MRRFTWMLGLAAAALASSCKEGPVAGEFAVNLVTPNSDDGAISFQIMAAAPSTIAGVSSPCNGCKLFLVKVNDSQYKGVVTGTISAGQLVRVSVSDSKKPAQYTVQILGVANRSYQVRSGAGYSVTLQ